MPRPKKIVMASEENKGGATAPPEALSTAKHFGVYRLRHNVVFRGRIYSAGQEVELSDQERDLLLPFLEV
jgi:hypothetical protein